MHSRIAASSLILIFSIILTVTGPAHAASHLVRADGTGDYATIQDAIDASVTGDTLLLVHGVFSGTGNWDIDFGGRDLVLKPANSVSDVTIDCLGGASGAHRAFHFHSGETSAAIIEHITITDGYLLDENGGGILISGSSPTIRNCIVRYCEVVDTGLPGLAYGGGICVQNGSPVLDHLVISTNTAGTYGGGIFCSGSGTPLVSSCTLSNNLCDYGAGMFVSSSSIRIVGCTFNWNGQAGTSGGGVYVSGVPAEGVTSIANCIFYTNYATAGSGIFASTSDPHVANCDFINNDPWVFQGDGGTITDCIFSNGGSEISAPGATVDYCWVEGGHSGTGNITGVTLNSVMGMSGQFSFPAGHEIENAGSDLASNICFENAAGTFCMDERTLLTFNQLDTGQVDIGYHYVRVPGIFDIPGTFSTIQAAIDNAMDGDRIRLTSEVTYHENIDFMGKDITVYGYVLTPGVAAHIEGDGTGPVVTINSGETSSAELRDLWISGGDAQHGGGIFIRDSSPTIDNCAVYSNTATYGGGIYCNNSSSELIDVSVYDNEAAIGGGIVVTYADVTIDGSHIYRNLSTGAGAGGVGGGIYCNYGSLSMTDTELYGNTAQEYSGASRGGAVYRTGFAVLPTVVSHCTLYNNTAITGSGIAAEDVDIAVNNTIIGWGNVGEAVSCEGTATTTLTCCDVYNNEGGDWTGGIDGQGGANGNISTDPIFNDAANDDLAFARNSPCAMELSGGCGNIGASWEGSMPQTVTVNPDGSGFRPTIQDAIDAAKGGWKILLANGTFTGAGNRDITFGSKSIELCALDGTPDSCVIDCEGSDIDEHRGILINGREGNFTRVEGITIRNAFTSGGGGAGMHINRSHPTVDSCTFINCIAFDGGGIQTYKSEAVITGCQFLFNYAFDAGGGIMNHTCSPAIRDCTFINNFGEWGGGGIYNHYSAPDIDRCVFSGNSSHHWGGALHNNHPESSPVLRNCTFSENSAPLGGHLYSRDNSAPVLYNSILVFSFEGVAAHAATGATTTLHCCDVYLNTGGDYVEALAGQDGIEGNFSADPEFCNQTSHNYRLLETSPCAQSNSGSCGLVGALWHGCSPTTDVEDADQTPTASRLHNCFPNPFNPTTTIRFDIAQPAPTSLKIYDVAGHLVRVLVDEHLVAGRYEEAWDGRNDAGQKISSGVYFYKLTTAEYEQTKKMVLIR